MATLSDYDNERVVFATIALQAYHAYGRDRALEMYRGAVDSLVLASRCLGVGIHLVENNKPTNSDGVAA